MNPWQWHAMIAAVVLGGGTIIVLRGRTATLPDTDSDLGSDTDTLGADSKVESSKSDTETGTDGDKTDEETKPKEKFLRRHDAGVSYDKLKDYNVTIEMVNAFYEENKDKIQMKLDPIEIDQNKFNKWKNSMVKRGYKEEAKVIQQSLRYISFQKFHQKIKEVSLDVVKKMNDSTYNNIVFFIPQSISKSNPWVFLLFWGEIYHKIPNNKKCYFFDSAVSDYRANFSPMYDMEQFLKTKGVPMGDGKTVCFTFDDAPILALNYASRMVPLALMIRLIFNQKTIILQSPILQVMQRIT